MRQYHISPPKQLRTTVQLPASKSISNRALVVSALAGGDLLPENVSDCDDTRVMCHALAESPDVVDIMAAGTAMRFLTAYYSVTPGCRVITGTERMRHRPIAVLVDALRALGADIEYTGDKGFPPLRIKGRSLDGGEISLPGNVSSQYISALMMIGPTLRNGLRLTLTGGIVSRPYIALTLRVMHAYGAVAEWVSDNVIEVRAGGYRPTPYYIENDWSAASYWYEMVALSTDADAQVRLPGLFKDSGQGDQAVKDMFLPLGVQTEFVGDGVVLSKQDGPAHERTESPLRHDFIQQPDLAQTLAVTCCALNIPFRFTGLQSLRIKETDRIAALEKELAKWGYALQDKDDCELCWLTLQTERHACGDETIDTYDDHRMAMSFAPACLRLGQVTINNPEVVSKSYPAYWNDLRHAGFEIKEEQTALYS